MPGVGVGHLGVRAAVETVHRSRHALLDLRGRQHHMFSTCDSVSYMSKMIQIRNVPDELHREAKARAARAGMSLSDYLLREVRRALATPPMEELLARREQRGRVDVGEAPAAAVRDERDSR